MGCFLLGGFLGGSAIWDGRRPLYFGYVFLGLLFEQLELCFEFLFLALEQLEIVFVDELVGVRGLSLGGHVVHVAGVFHGGAIDVVHIQLEINSDVKVD